MTNCHTITKGWVQSVIAKCPVLKVHFNCRTTTDLVVVLSGSVVVLSGSVVVLTGHGMY